MTKREQYLKLLRIESVSNTKNELVRYDEDVLKEVYQYFVETGKKRYLQEMIWSELRLRHEQKLYEEQEHVRRFGNNPKWAREWSEQWEEARMRIRKARIKSAAE